MSIRRLSVQDRDALSASQFLRAGIDPVDPNASAALRDQQTRAAELGEQFRNRTMLEIVREIAIKTGGEAHGNDRDMIRAATSGGELSGVFSNVANASLQKSFQEYPDSTDWCRDTLVTSFQTHESYRLAKASNVNRLARGDEAVHAVISDTTESYKVARYAVQFVVDEQDIIDDKFGAFTQIPEQLGQACARVRADLVYSELLANAALGADSVALFHAATHGNLATGGPSALTASSLAAGIVAMATQMEGDAKLNLRPAFLIVPQDLYYTALVLLKSVERIISADSGGTYNPLRSEHIAIRSDDRIGANGVTSPATKTEYTGSATNWFLAANPIQAPTIEVGFLRQTGKKPVLRSWDRREGTWGIGFDCKLDIGVKAMDWRGLYKSEGA